MNLFLSTIEQAAQTFDNIVVELKSLKNQIEGVIKTQKQEQIGEALNDIFCVIYKLKSWLVFSFVFIEIPTDIVNVIVATINQISNLNGQVTAEINSAVKTANDYMTQYIGNGKPLSGMSFYLHPSKVCINYIRSFYQEYYHSINWFLGIAESVVGIELIKLFGEYIGDVTNVIGNSTNVNTSNLPVVPINSQEEVVGKYWIHYVISFSINAELCCDIFFILIPKLEIPQLLQKLNGCFASFKSVYHSLSNVFSSIEEVVPIGFALLNVLNGNI